MLVIQLKYPNYKSKISEIEKKITGHNQDKYTTSKFNRLTAEHFAARLAQGNLVTKTDFDNELINFNKKLTQ